jgi:DNA-binding transcriptional regulator PaaX
MQVGWKKKLNAVTSALKQFREDWLPFEEMYIPPYSGSREWYPGIKEEKARRAIARKRQEAQRRLAYFKRKKWVEIKKTADGLFAKLTDAGKVERLKRTLYEHPRLKDARVCLVFFDFPEQARTSRDMFRYFLKGCGFRLVQLSVWMSDRDVAEEILKFVKQARIEKWVQVFVGERK